MMTQHPFPMAAVKILLGMSIALGTLGSQAQTAMNPSERDALARSAYARGDIPRAAAALNESVRVNPFDPVALNNLAVSYAAQGDYQNALSLLERALRIAPNRSDIMNNHANLRAWMAQDTQFALGSRPTSAPLNFPRAEDSPQNFPPLWAPPPQMQNPPVVRPSGQQSGPPPLAANVGSTAYPQYTAVPGYGQVPTYSMGAPQQPPQPVMTMAQAAPEAIVPRKSTSSQQSIAPRQSTEPIARKKKRPVAVDCKVEP